MGFNRKPGGTLNVMTTGERRGDLVPSTTDATVLAYKGLDGVPLWLLFGIAVLALVILGAARIRKRK
ncbi:hypothetical protein ACIP25_22590 [Streptomyces massasporeus]|uniref:hypothetical protein n=1 Tax=Streptomyces massasporeus TaxID=67324 RepID=UPI0037FA8189